MKEALFICAYLAGSFLTFGSVYNSYVEVDCGVEPKILEDRSGWSDWHSCDFHKRHAGGPYPFISGVIWPAYWAGRAAIAITRP